MSNYPYNPYSYNPQQYQQQYVEMQKKASQKRELRRRSTLIGCGIIIYVVLCVALIVLTVRLSGNSELYDTNALFSNCVQIFVSIIALLGAFFIVRRVIDKKHVSFIPFGAPANKKHALLLIPFGVAACLAGSIATGYMDQFLQKAFDVVFTEPEFAEPTTPFEAVIFLISTALVPAFVEEITLRAGVLQAMRKYGDWFAIITSSFIFAVLHGNMIQTPFAFIAGIALGYVFIATGSIWPGIAIHFINNFVSSLVTVAYAFGLDDKIIGSVFDIYAMSICIIGLVCFLVYFFDKKRPVLQKDTSLLSLPQKTGAFLINVPMIVSLIYVFYATAGTIER